MFERLRKAVRIIFPKKIPKKGIAEGKFPFTLTVCMGAEMKRHCRKMADTYGSMSNFVRMLVHSHMKGETIGVQVHVPKKTLTVERVTYEEPVLENQEEENDDITDIETPNTPPFLIGRNYGEHHGSLMQELRKVLKKRSRRSE